MNDALQAEQQLGFPAGAAAGASSLDTAAPTVSILLENQIFHYIFHISLIPQQHLLLMSAHIPFLFHLLPHKCLINLSDHFAGAMHSKPRGRG